MFSIKKLCIRDNFIKILKLSIPLILTGASLELMGITDSIMLGRFDTKELAYYTLSNSIFYLILEICLGLLLGTLILSSEAFGKKKFSKCGCILKRSIPYAIFISLISIIICSQGTYIFGLTKQTYLVAKKSGEILSIMGLITPAMLIYGCYIYFLDSIEQVKIPMIISFITNILNIICNWIFIYGAFGFEPMGAIGCAISTLISSYLSLIIIITHSKQNKHILKFIRKAKINNKDMKRQKELGYAAGISMGLEETSITLLFIIIGWIGTNELSIFGIYYTIICILFMMSRGIGQAAAIMIGAYHGKKNYHASFMSGTNSLVISIIINLLFIIIIYQFSHHIYGFYTTDKIIYNTLISLTPIFLCGLLFDSIQTTLANILRGRGETWFLSYIQFGISNFIMLPTAYILAISYHLGLKGILISYAITTTMLFCAQITRFIYLHKKDINNSILRRILYRLKIHNKFYSFTK